MKKKETEYSGTVKRIGMIPQDGSSNGGTCYAVLLEDEKEPRIIETLDGLLSHDEREVVDRLRLRIALTAPGDKISVKMCGDRVVDLINASLPT